MQAPVSTSAAEPFDEMRDFLLATDAIAVCVDDRLRASRCTPRAAAVMGLSALHTRPSLLDTEFAASYPDMAADAAQMFASLALVEREIRVHGGGRYVVRWLPDGSGAEAASAGLLALLDITALRRAEERAHAAGEQLRLVTEEIDEAVITLDERGCIVDWSVVAARMLGHAAGVVSGHSFDELWPAGECGAGVLQRALHRIDARGRIRFERPHLHQDGSTRLCRVSVVAAGGGRSYRYVVVLRDRTPRADGEFERCDDVRRAHAQKNEFLAVMSHELRHPLNLISVTTEALARMQALQGSEPAMKAADQIRRAVAQQTQIIDDLFDLTRMQTGKLKLSPREIDAVATLGHIAEAAQADASAAGLEFRLRLPARSVRLYADPVRLDQIVWNLLSNAIKFTPAGGIVELRVTVDASRLRIDVADSGQGIDAQTLPHVFDMYGQGASGAKRHHGGLGIGLALVRELVELQHGSVEAYSAGVGRGSRFTLWLPLRREHAQTASPAQHRSAFERLRVLVVDDDHDTVEAFCALLRLEGALPAAAYDATQALRIIDTGTFDVLVSDLQMPGMDGYAFIRRVRAGKRNRSLWAIAVSGNDRDDDVRHALDDGFDAHLSKPLCMPDLLDAVVRAQWMTSRAPPPRGDTRSARARGLR